MKNISTGETKIFWLTGSSNLFWMQVFIKIENYTNGPRTITINDVSAEETVETFKRKIVQKLNCKTWMASMFYLVHGKYVLESGLLKTYGITSGSTIKLSFRQHFSLENIFSSLSI